MRGAWGFGLLGRRGAGPRLQCLLPGPGAGCPRSQCGQGRFPLRPPLGLYVAGLLTLLTAPLPSVTAWPGEVPERHWPGSLILEPEMPSDPYSSPSLKRPIPEGTDHGVSYIT